MSDYTARASRKHNGAMPQVLAEHERLVHWVVRRQWLGELSYAEAAHVGRIALWRAGLGYDPQRGYAFSTYAVHAMQRAIWTAVDRARPDPREVLMRQPPRSAPDLEAGAETLWAKQALQELVAGLPPRLRFVIHTRYGLAGAEAQTYAAIGRALGVTKQRAHQLHAEALLWLGHPTYSLRLRQRLGCNTVADYRAYLARQRTWRRQRR
jgi:RNA polymerase sigma factor (sigma-70 family)